MHFLVSLLNFPPCRTTSLEWILKCSTWPIRPLPYRYRSGDSSCLHGPVVLTVHQSRFSHCLQAWSFPLIACCKPYFMPDWLTSTVFFHHPSVSAAAIACSHLRCLCLCRSSLSLAFVFVCYTLFLWVTQPQPPFWGGNLKKRLKTLSPERTCSGEETGRAWRNKKRGSDVRRERDLREETQTRQRQKGKKERNQGKSGMGADFCQQEVSVTMVTRQRSDVIACNRCLALWGYFFWGGGLAVQICSSPSALYCRTSGEKRNGDNPVNELVKFWIYEFNLVSADNKKMHWLNIRHSHCVCVPAPALPCSFTWSSFLNHVLQAHLFSFVTTISQNRDNNIFGVFAIIIWMIYLLFK